MLALWNALIAIPKLIDAIQALLAVFEKWEKDKELAKIDQTEKNLEGAKSDEDLIQAARDAASATSHL